MRDATVSAVQHSNLILFIVDASVGVTALDHAHAKWLRSCLTPQKSIILVANKCDVADSDKRAIEAYQLGFGDPVLISAEQALGFADLYERIRDVPAPPRIEQKPAPQRADSSSDLSEEEAEIRSSFDDELVISTSARLRESPLQQLIVSIIGRPNVGKSTLMNRLVGEERSIVAAAAGVTRDAVLSPWTAEYERSEYPPVWLVDTPGVRGEAKVTSDNLERLMVRASLQALRCSHVVVVVTDAVQSLTRQDVKLLDVVVTEGRAVVLVVNKMDVLHEADMNDWRARLRYEVDSKLEQLKGVEVVEMSAKNWQEDPTQGKRLYDAVQRARGRWEKRVSTSALNRFVKNFNERMSVGGGTRGERRNRIGVTKFITQKKIRPPMFRLDGSSAVSMNYLRALSNAIRHEFGFEGVPIRVKRPSRRQRR
ncbi:50S ribosome-binding GTPase [Gracilaria domingensis]|nr:50S ribosome-binding GTPase [Gracilaria domingensis]